LSKTIGFCDLKFLANFALNYWPDGTRIETKRSHSPTVEGKEGEKRASVVGFARVLVESERVENSNLKIFLFFTFFFGSVSLVFSPQRSSSTKKFLTHYSKERAPTLNTPQTKGHKTQGGRTDATREFVQKKVRILPAFKKTKNQPKPTLLVLHE